MEEGGRENRGLIMGVFWSCDFQSDRLILVISPSAELDFMDYLWIYRERITFLWDIASSFLLISIS